MYEILTRDTSSTNANASSPSNTSLAEIVSYFSDANNLLYETNFIRAMNSTDKYIMATCNYCYAVLLSVGNGSSKGYCAYLNEQLQSVNMLENLSIPLTIFLRKEENRTHFLENLGIRLLSNLLSKLGPNGNAQYIYELVFAMWSLSLCFATPDATFNLNMSVEQSDTKPFLNNGVIPLISELLAAAPSKKVIRMSVAVSSEDH